MASFAARRALSLGCSRLVNHKFGSSVRYASSFFTEAHEYVKVDGKIGTCGISDFAQSALGEIVYIDLPSVGDEFAKGDSYGSVESVKAASEVYAPISGKVVEVNSAVTDNPGMVNSNAEDKAWFIKLEISDSSETSELMDQAAYKTYCENEAH